jgi:anhydro-N-acetylmuramic acid kinase
MERPVVVVNIGGVANVTYVGAKGELIAFDTGPGNAALDDWAQLHTGEAVDRDGKLARAGKVNETVLAFMLNHPVFRQPPPKSLDRFDFPMTAVSGLSAQAGAATLTAFTAAAIARSAEHLPAAPLAWIICGGGRHNPALIDELRARLKGKVMTAEDAGWRGDFLEAEAFAYLALRSVRGLPLSLPSTTGVPDPMPGGRLHMPKG